MVTLQPQLDIIFAERPGIQLRGDLFLPSNLTPAPVLLFIHGGGWQAGERSAGHQWGRLLAQNGIATFCIQYRLAGKDRSAYPEALEDVRAGLGYLRTRTDLFDIGRMGLFGASAGAHLAALAALAPERTMDAKVKVCICAYGIYDLEEQWRHDCEVRPDNNLVDIFLGTPPTRNPAIYRDASPMAHLEAAAPGPAFLITYGMKDKVVKPSQSETFAAAARSKGFDIETFVAEEAGHFWLSKPIEEAGSASANFAPVLVDFLNRKLKASG